MKKRILFLGIFAFLFVPYVPASELQELEERIEVLEVERWGFRPDRSEWLEFGGEIRTELIVPESDEVDNFIEIDRIEQDFRATIAKGVYSRGTLIFSQHRDQYGEDYGFEIDEWYTSFALGSHWLRVGITDRFIEPGNMDRGHRTTIGHPLSSVAFWRDEHYNITLGGTLPGIIGDELRYRISYGSGFVLDDRRPGNHRFEDPAVGESDELLHDDEYGMFGDEIGVGLGTRFNFMKSTLDLVGFGILSRMHNEPACDVLTGWPEEKNQHRIGGRIAYSIRRRMLLMAEYINAIDGNLSRDAFYVQASYRINFPSPLLGGIFFTGIQPLVRYNQYSVDTEADFNDPLTWDRTQITAAVRCLIVRNVTLNIEYSINTEETGGDEIENNELRTTLRVRW